MRYRLKIKPWCHHVASFYAGPYWGFYIMPDGGRQYFGGYASTFSPRMASEFNIRGAWKAAHRFARLKLGTCEIEPVQ